MLAPIAAYFAKLWSAVASEPPLWEGGGIHKPRDRHVPLPHKAVALPPHSKALRAKSAENVMLSNEITVALRDLEARRGAANADAMRVASEMIAGVRTRGDAFVREQVERFD